MRPDDPREQPADERTPVVSVTIMGQEYPVRAEVDVDYLRGLAAKLDQRMRSLHESEPSRQPLKIAVLTALNLMDELASLRRENHELSERYEARAREMLDDLTRRLVEPPSLADFGAIDH